MISTLAMIATWLLLVAVFYWFHFLDKNKNDERGDQIVGKAAKISFSSYFVIMALIAIFYLTERITSDLLFNYMVIGLSLGAVIHAGSLYFINRSYQ